MIEEYQKFQFSVLSDATLSYSDRSNKLLAKVDDYFDGDRDALLSIAIYYLLRDGEYERVIALSSTNVATTNTHQYKQDLYLYWAQALEASNRMEEAIEVRRVKMVECNEGSMFYDVAKVYEKAGDIDNALQYYDKHLIEEGAYMDLEDMERIADLYEKRRDYTNSAKYLRLATIDECKRTDYLWQNTGRALALAGHPDEAMKYFEVALMLNPECENTHYCMGQVYQDKGDQYRAMHHYTKVLKINPNNAMVYNNLGAMSFNEEGDIKGAIEKIEEALEMSPDAQLKLKMHINLASLYKKISDYDKHNYHKKKIMEAAGFGGQLEDEED